MPHGPRALVAGQPFEDVLLQVPLTGDSVHDLELRWVAGRGTQQPVAPGCGLVAVARRHERGQGERRIAQPAVAVVPVSLPTERFRQGGGGRGKDAAGRLVGERLQGDERSDHCLAPTMRLEIGKVRPLLPPALGLLDHVLGGDGTLHFAVGREMGEHERNMLALAEAELGDGAHVLAPSVRCRPQRQAVRPGHRHELAVVTAHPRHDRPVFETDLQIHAHFDRAPRALDQPHDSRALLPQRHAVGDANAPLRQVELALEQEGVRDVPATRRQQGLALAGRRARGRSDPPEPVSDAS